MDHKDIWRHNSFLGHAAMMKKQALAIIDSKTTTERAKGHAQNIWWLADQLAVALKERNPS